MFKQPVVTRTVKGILSPIVAVKQHRQFFGFFAGRQVLQPAACLGSAGQIIPSAGKAVFQSPAFFVAHAFLTVCGRNGKQNFSDANAADINDRIGRSSRTDGRKQRRGNKQQPMKIFS